MSTRVFKLASRRGFLQTALAASALAQAQSAATWRRGETAVARGGLGGGKQLAVQVRLSGPATISIGAAAQEPVLRMEPTPSGGLMLALRTDANAKPLTLDIPPAGFQPAGLHELLFRYEGPRAELYIDGVLVDEEWPMGALPFEPGARLEVHGDAVESLRISQEHLPERPDQSRFAERAAAILGPERRVGQYWRPRGHNASAGDTMPFFHDGRFHVYYLFDRRHHGSKWGLGAHQWAHISSTDLHDWEQHRMALPITEEGEASICTGSVFYDEGLYYAFYATRQADRRERLSMATSPDGIDFEKLTPTPFSEPRAPYRRGPNRDPFVFQAAPHDYRMLATAELERPEAAHRGGALELLTSSDLRHWTPQAPSLVPGYPGQPECSDLFAWNDWYYLLFAPDGATRYRMARSVDGPWLAPACDLLDSPQARVMKTAAFTGNRRIGVAFIPEGGWGGDLVFRELMQRSDGTLGTRRPPELELEGPTVPWKVEPAEAQRPGGALEIDTRGGYGYATLAPVAPNVRIRLRMRPSPGVLQYGLIVRGAGLAESGMELRLDPGRRCAEWRPTEAGTLQQNHLAAIDAVDGLSGEVLLDAIVRGDIFDVCLNGDRTLVHRAQAPAGDRVFVWAQGGRVMVDRISITEANV
jgi:beta-fructofuranosidase